VRLQKLQERPECRGDRLELLRDGRRTLQLKYCLPLVVLNGEWVPITC
jgi:hypothetical protein